MCGATFVAMVARTIDSDGGMVWSDGVKIVIVVASAAGCFAALLLARTGHEGWVVEKDRLELAPDVEAAATRACCAPCRPTLDGSTPLTPSPKSIRWVGCTIRCAASLLTRRRWRQAWRRSATRYARRIRRSAAG